MLRLYCYRKKLGMSLVEVMIASTILLIALGIIYSSYLSGTRYIEITEEETNLQAKARIAMHNMINELRNATRTSTQNPSPNLFIPSAPNNKSIHFYLPDKDESGRPIIDSSGNIVWDTNNQIDYQYIPGKKILRRLEKGDFKILANDVVDVQFIDHSIDFSLALDEVKIILTLSKTTSQGRSITFTLSGIVHLRN